MRKPSNFSGAARSIRPGRPARPAAARILLSLGLDVLDPAWAPGISNPAPLGWRAKDLLEALLEGTPRALADLGEYDMPHAPGRATGVLAAWPVCEILLALTPP